jgi:ATP-dependent RNA helicase DDX49/DBP8
MFAELKLTFLSLSLGITSPSPIQINCIPAILEGKDVIGVAQTGSGKTLAFALPIVQTLSKDPYGIYALVLTPTRELAFQIADQLKIVGKPIGVRDTVIVGGRDMVQQGRELEDRPHVVIATPGRLADHFQSCDTFHMKKIKYLVLDEADRLLDGSFDEQLEIIFAKLPKERQTMLFTATVTDSLEKLREASMRGKPFFYQAPAKQATVDGLDQRFILTPVEAREGYLVHLVQTLRDKRESGSMIIFVKTCKTCEVVSMMLNYFEFVNVSLHSQKPQRERLMSLVKFRSNQVRILVATDVASRGLDIPNVDYVINHDVPSVTKNYVHRVGRTARAGRKGAAFTLVTPHDVSLVKAIETLIRTKLTEYTADDEHVAEILTQVNVTRREQELKLETLDFGEKKEINRRKQLIRQGLDPDEEDKKRERERRKRIKAVRRENNKKRKVLEKVDATAMTAGVAKS